MVARGFTVFDHDVRVAAWSKAAWDVVQTLDLRPDRCGETWHVGVDALPNELDGSINGVPLDGPWDIVSPSWHRAQISVIYPGYPKLDSDESDAAHRFRIDRCAAHMDGLLPEGPKRRRHLREPHAFILGLPLNDVAVSPLMVWPGSHLIMAAAFQAAFKDSPSQRWGEVDVTDNYQQARRDVFERCEPEPVLAKPGQAILLHRHLIHGVAPWQGEEGQARAIAYFRPMLPNVADWF